MTAARSAARAAALELLERRHGLGVRAGALPSWMVLRLDRALDALVARHGDHERALAALTDDAAELERIAELLRVGETSFFRDPPQWDALAERVLPRFSGRVRALSAGCSTGEEAWSLSMLLAASGADYRVVGVDRSEAALEAARAGVYPSAAAARVPHALAARYLERDGDWVRVSDTLRAKTSFVARDVMLGPPPGSYELILCKNLLIYFGDEAGERVVGLLARALTDHGVLVVARSEVARLRAMGRSTVELAPGITVICR
ncbi:MAG: chemotaxis protein [Polyangiaceae bacterium]|nr:chemotaxis protein [Polyangiaceae bacterium]